jgi:hypothetical protein
MNKIIGNVEDVKLLIDKYERFKDRIFELLRGFYDGCIEEINIEYSDDDLEISFTANIYCRGERFGEDYCIVLPIAWLFLNDEELKEAKKRKKEEEEEKKRKQEELNEIFRKKAQEQEDREEYERLKAKFEK